MQCAKIRTGLGGFMLAIEYFEQFKNHAWHSRTYKKLSASDIAIAKEFLTSIAKLSKDEQVQKCNRMFLDKDKPKKWKEINELCACAITRLP